MKIKVFICVIAGITLLGLSAFSQESVAELRKDIGMAKFRNLELDTTTLFAGDRFVTYKDTWEARWGVWTNKGESGSLDSCLIQVLPGEQILKLVTDTQTLFRVACYQSAINEFKRSGYKIDICDLVRAAANHDHDAFRKICECIEFPEKYPSNYPQSVDLTLLSIIERLLHLYDDEEFAIFLKETNRKLRFKIARYITAPWFGYPIDDQKTYYKIHYPQTWKIIKWQRDRRQIKMVRFEEGIYQRMVVRDNCIVHKPCLVIRRCVF